MTGPWQFSDAFLRNIPSESKAVLEARRGAWEAGVGFEKDILKS